MGPNKNALLEANDYSMKYIVSLGTIASIELTMEKYTEKERTADQTIAEIRTLIDIYDKYFRTGRTV